ncbi:hypothetical protein ABT097_27515 [Streptomyces sp. NPDC002225]|uniref:hypothetical protein n=1 Tax=Streptomyces sp. NPDC002225 TaxID=3154413 RepID=UPI0033194F6D
MGLMSWLRGGGRTAESGPSGPGGPQAPDFARRERVDLAELPPIQRTLGAQELTIDPVGFQGALSTRQDTSLGTPLGHLVSPEAPTGLVHGITAPAGPELPAASGPGAVQRAVEGVVELPRRGGGPPLAVSVQRVVAGGAPAMTSAGGAAEAEAPVRRLVGEQPPVAVVAPEPVAGQGPVVPTATDVPVQRAVGPGTGATRRAPGLGAPMAGLPPTAQRLPAGAAPDGADGPVPVAPGGGGGEPRPVSPPDATAPAPAPSPDAPTAPLLGDSPLLPASAPEPAPDPGDSGGPDGLGPAPGNVDTGPGPVPAVQRFPGVPQRPLAPPPASDPVAPLLADRPLEPRNGPDAGPAAVQRSAVDGVVPAPPAGVGPSPAVPDAADAVPVRWADVGPGAPSLATVTPSSSSVPAALQRTAAAPHPGPPGAPPPRAPLPSLQRRAAGGPPVPRSVQRAAGPTAPAFTTAGAAALAAGVAQRAADGSVVFGPPPPAYATPVVQRETVTEEPPPPDPPAPDQPQDPVPEPEPEPGPGPEAAPGTAGAHPAPAGTGPGGAPVVTDELVRALYPPLSRLFKADLRLDRERAGFLINTRH